MDERFDKIDERFDKMDVRMDKMDVRLDNLEDSVGDMQDSMATLKGKSYENEVVSKINSVLGRFARRGRDARNEICNSLDNMEDAGTLSTQEYGEVVSADLLWQGVLHKSKEPFYVVGEISWLAELHDVERASQRAQIVQRAGLHAVPLVAGEKWTYEAIEAAKKSGVVRVRQLAVEKDSWLPGLESVKNGSDLEKP